MDLFGRARRMFQGIGTEDPPAPQSYRVTCPQGHVLRGQRTEGYQAIRCPGCDEGIFVLPRSPLPDPPAPAVDRPKQRATRPEPIADDSIRWSEAPPEVSLADPETTNVGEVEIQWEDDIPTEPAAEPAPIGRAPAPRPRTAAQAHASASRPERPRRRTRERPLDGRGLAAQIALPPAPSLGQRLRRHRHALAVLGVLLFVVVTVAFRMHQRYWERLPEIAEVNQAEGLEALANGVFDVAKRKLAVAADALEALGDQDAAQVRQAAREAAIFADLASLSLEEIVEEVATRSGAEAQEWFESRHRGRSILIDARIVATSPGKRTVDYQIYSGGKRGWLDLTDLALLAGKPDGEPVTFGARFDSITLDETGEWRVTFEPDSGVYLSTAEGWEGLRSLGWPDREPPGDEVGLTVPLALRFLTALLLVPQGQGDPPTVRVRDLTTRADLVGRTVVVDGRIDRFDFQRDQGWRLLRLVDSPVLFRLPPALTSPRSQPTERTARLQGVLKREGGGFAFDVTAMTLYESDMARLEAAVSGLASTDYKNRDAWARWAEQRAREYADDALLARARELAGEAIRLQAEAPGEDQSPRRQLELAREARRREAPPAVPASLVHRALRTLLPEVTKADEAEQLARTAEELLPPEARTPRSTDIRGWLAAYEEDPATTYLRADPAARAGLDRRLLAGALRKAFELRAAEDPSQALAVAERAAAELPDDPALARELRQEALKDTDVASLRLAEVQERARLYESMGQPEQARELLRAWLNDQRANRLSPSDAEGRVLLAQQFEGLIDDTETAVELLREAWRIDPGSETTAAAFRQRGYRQVEGEWVASSRSATRREDPEAASERATPKVGRDPYIGLTPNEVVNLMGGRPARVVRSATQGQICEQWIYELGGGRTLQYINFVHRPGQPRAVAVSSFQRAP